MPAASLNSLWLYIGTMQQMVHDPVLKEALKVPVAARLPLFHAAVLQFLNAWLGYFFENQYKIRCTLSVISSIL